MLGKGVRRDGVNLAAPQKGPGAVTEVELPVPGAWGSYLSRCPGFSGEAVSFAEDEEGSVYAVDSSHSVTPRCTRKKMKIKFNKFCGKEDEYTKTGCISTHL